ncbi:transcriptional regulator, LuxR family [Rhodopseudomonas palustris BisB18]|uniref:Transcriptional regulator, LuxR family n=2 Tax=Rhodopseudomonas palustris TaxID=1076 RepID=Q216V3_RHOPB
MTSGAILWCLEKIRVAATADDLHHVLRHICEAYQLAHAVFHATDTPAVRAERPLLILTYPAEWVENYTRRDYFKIDPVVAIGRVGFLSLDWSTIDQKTASSAKFFREADEFGVGRHGLTTTVRGPSGERSLFTVTSNANAAQWTRQRDACIHEFQIIANHFHQRAMISTGLRGGDGPLPLSKREKQCIELLAKGFLPKQIAALLDLSESAIRLYLCSARRKLQASTTSQAIAIALSLELITA